MELFHACVAFEPSLPATTNLALIFQQTVYSSGSFQSDPPHLLIYRVRPETAERFELIRLGDLDGLIRSLDRKESLLSDRDSHGRCLLHVRTCETRST